MNKTQIKIALPIIIEGIIFSLAVKFLFNGCGPKDDGSFMKCHWSEQAVFALTLALIFTGIIALFVKSKDIARGLAFSLIPFGAVIISIPNYFIGACKMAEMRCRTTLVPGATVSGIIILITGLVLFFVTGNKSDSKE